MSAVAAATDAAKTPAAISTAAATPADKKGGAPIVTAAAVSDSSRFQGAGVSFKGKLIGVDEVPESRGEKMCQISMAKLKAVVLAMKEHKRPITVNISVNGLKISDDKSEDILHAHLVHRISFIFRDTTDARAFGYIYRREDGVHQFFAVKTDKPAEGLVSSLRELFESVYNQKKKEAEEVKPETVTEPVTEAKEEQKEETKEPDFKNPPPSNDLLNLGDFQNFEQNVFGVSAAPSQSTANAWLLNTYGSNGVHPTAQGAYPMMGAAPGVPHHMQQGVYSTPQQLQMTSSMQQLQLQQVQQQQIQQQQMLYVQQQQSHQQQQQAFAWRQQQPYFPPGPGTLPGAAWPQQGAVPNVQTHPGQPWGQPQGGAVPGIRPNTQDQSAMFQQPFIQVQPLKRDPFADLAVMSAPQGPSALGPPTKKIGKDDFVKEPPKPTLFDVSLSQQEAALDPFGGSSAESNPFSTSASNDPFA